MAEARPPGRGFPRPAAFAVLALVLGALAWMLLARGSASASRGPLAVPNPEAEAPAEFLVGAVRHIVAPSAPQRLILDTIAPTDPVRLLWLQGRAVARLSDGSALALDGAGGLIRFDSQLTQRRPFTTGPREIVSVAATSDGAVWVTDADGAVLRRTPEGRWRQAQAAPFRYPAVATDPSREDVWTTRRPDRWDYRLPTPQPLFARFNAEGRVDARAGTALVPAEQLLTDFASAGHIVVAGDTLYFAPFIRDEIMAFAPSGDTLWVASRELPQSTREPRLIVEGKTGMIDYFPVNIGLALGPDGRLYVLSTPGFTTGAGRLDAFDRFSGHLVRSTQLATALPTLAADGAGRVYLLDAFRLLTGVPPGEREPFGEFALEQLGGGVMTSADLAGKVTLINFWASWCKPCRTEMPALDSLRRDIEDPDFRFLTMNEDLDGADAEQFLRVVGLDVPALLGHGRLRERFHYVGLPYTVLLDRDGRVVQRWLGFAGPEQIEAERAVIMAELARGMTMQMRGDTSARHRR